MSRVDRKTDLLRRERILQADRERQLAKRRAREEAAQAAQQQAAAGEDPGEEAA
jgi:hypothetical protein